MSATLASGSRRGRATTRARITRVIGRHARRERLTLMLLLVERMRPIEIAATLGVSVRQVERTLDALFDELSRAERRARPVRLRRAA
ncbi:MAG: helix-turn-helix domain-containing protein [Candidatus Eisenbacteria bacterium]